MKKVRKGLSWTRWLAVVLALTLMPLGGRAQGTYPSAKRAVFGLKRLETHQEGDSCTRLRMAARELSLASVPFIAGGFASRSIKHEGREVRFHMAPRYESIFDDYIQYTPLAATWIMKVAGVEGRSDWPRFIMANACSYVLMAGIANGMKYTIRDTRPDGTSSNSFPSGHTALAFTAATILHKEYGMTRSPWYSVGGYAVATTTAVSRVLNNRHWSADVICGAGVGILSTELGYFLTDLILGDGHYVREVRPQPWNPDPHPSFVAFEMGKTWVPNIREIRTRVGNSVGVEGAYLFNPYVGVVGRLRVSSAEATHNAYRDFFTTFAMDAGVYGEYPLSKHWNMGGKVTYGRMHVGYMAFDDLYVPSTWNNKVGVGASVTYQARYGVAWHLHADYDYARVPFEFRETGAGAATPTTYRTPLHMLTLGASAEIRF